MSTDRPDVSKHSWTAEFWVSLDGPCGAAVASSNHGALLLRTSPLSGRPGCVGLSLCGGVEHAFADYRLPTGRATHLAFVATKKPLNLQLFADGALVGSIPGVAMAMPMGCVGDSSHSFRGLLFGARFWRVALSSADVESAARRGPVPGAGAALTQSGDDCVADWDLTRGGGCKVEDRSGDSSALLVGGVEWTSSSSSTPPPPPPSSPGSSGMGFWGGC